MSKKIPDDVIKRASELHFVQLDRLLKESGDLIYEGLRFEKEGNIDKARKLYTDALEICNAAVDYDSHSAGAWSNKAICLMRLGRLKEALECINRALELEPRDQAYLLNKRNIIRKMEERK